MRLARLRGIDRASGIAEAIVNPPHTHVTHRPADHELCARLLWAERSWRCFVTPSSVRLYSGGKRLLAHPVRDREEGEQIAGLWQRSIRRIDDLARQTATV